MLKTILNLKGATQLSTMQQSNIFGGIGKCCIPRPSNEQFSTSVTENNKPKPCNPKPECSESSCAC